MRHILLSLLVLFCFTSCDVIEGPYTEDPTGGGPIVDVERKILLEEFTGHKCGNCPRASKFVHDLKTTTYPDQLIVLTVHAGELAEPELFGTQYTTDFRTSTGDALYTDFQLDAVPKGLVNRIELVGQDAWASQIAQELTKEAEVAIEVTHTFNDATRELSISVEVDALADLTEQEYLALYLIEDEVTDWQKDYDSNPRHVEEYVHHDVLRGAINSTWGDKLSNTAIAKGASFTKTYTYTVDSDFNADNCKILAFVHDNTTKYIRQVEEHAIGQ